MSRPSSSVASAARINGRVAAWSIVAAVVLIFVLANAHLAYVALASQPDCTGQSDERAAGGSAYHAASPAC